MALHAGTQLRSAADVSPTAKKAPSGPAPKPDRRESLEGTGEGAREAPPRSRPRTRKRPPKRSPAEEEPRKLTDPRVIRALAHPVRIALLEALVEKVPYRDRRR